MKFEDIYDAVQKNDDVDLGDLKLLSEYIITLAHAKLFVGACASKFRSEQNQIEKYSFFDYWDFIPATIDMCEGPDWVEGHNGTDLGKFCWYVFYAAFLE